MVRESQADKTRVLTFRVVERLQEFRVIGTIVTFQEILLAQQL